MKVALGKKEKLEYLYTPDKAAVSESFEGDFLSNKLQNKQSVQFLNREGITVQAAQHNKDI